MKRQTRRLSIETLEDRTTPNAGDLDLSFDSDGTVLGPFGNPVSDARAVVTDSQDRIVVAGFSTDAGDWDFLVARYLPDGSLDPTFAGDGTAPTPFNLVWESAHSVVIDHFGRIIVVGTASNGVDYENFAIACYLTDGTLDQTFGSNGYVTTDFHLFADVARDVVIDSFGRIVVGGYTWNHFDGNVDFALARYVPDGSLDLTFGDAGKVTTPISNDEDLLTQVAIDPSGGIVVAGFTRSSDSAVLARYLDSGTLDPAFGVGGVVRLPALFERADAITVDDAGRPIVVGTMQRFNGIDMFAARLLVNGELDSSFGDGGRTLINFGEMTASMGHAVELDGAGRILVSGHRSKWNDKDFGVARLLSNGTLDAEFGVDGRVTTPFDPLYSSVYSISVDRLGRIVAAGNAQIASTNNVSVAVARYEGDPGPLALLDIQPLTFVENDEAKKLDPNVSISGQGADDLIGARISLLNFIPGEDSLTFDPRAGISANFDAQLGILELTGDASRSEYESALRSIAYLNVSEAPSTITRTVTVTLLDQSAGNANPVAARKIFVHAVNDAPSLANVPGEVTAFPGLPFSMPFSANDVDEQSGLRFSLLGAPPGMTVDPLTQTVNWLPSPDEATGVHLVEIRVDDSSVPSAHASRSFRLIVSRTGFVGDDLMVSGTNDSDAIVVARNTDPSRFDVLLDNSVIGSYANASLRGRIVIHGFDGADRLAIVSTLDFPVDLHGGGGNDTLLGGPAADRLDGGSDHDRLVAGPGADVFVVGPGSDVLVGGPGVDTVNGPDSTALWKLTGRTSGRVASARFTGVEELLGADGADTFVLPPGRAFAGTIDGGGGGNALDYATRTQAVFVNLLLGTASGAARILHIDNVIGGSGSDLLIGGANANRLYGRGGRDILVGGAGNDILVGDAGDDLLIGGMTVFDQAHADMLLIRSEWVSPASYSRRIAHLAGTVSGGRSEGRLLNDATLVDDAGGVDALLGSARLDWFIVGDLDSAIDLESTETITHH